MTGIGKARGETGVLGVFAELCMYPDRGKATESRGLLMSNEQIMLYLENKLSSIYSKPSKRKRSLVGRTKSVL